MATKLDYQAGVYDGYRGKAGRSIERDYLAGWKQGGLDRLWDSQKGGQGMIASFPEKQFFWFPCPMNQLKKRRGKNRTCGPYYTTRELITGAHPDWSFYLESDFAPGLRWQWCDDVTPRIDHSGWFTDEYGDGDKIRGIVFRLPSSLGFLAGWSMGIDMASEIDCTIYEDETDAAYAADSMAEDAAEREREY